MKSLGRWVRPVLGRRDWKCGIRESVILRKLYRTALVGPVELEVVKWQNWWNSEIPSENNVTEQWHSAILLSITAISFVDFKASKQIISTSTPWKHRQDEQWLIVKRKPSVLFTQTRYPPLSTFQSVLDHTENVSISFFLNFEGKDLDTALQKYVFYTIKRLHVRSCAFVLAVSVDIGWANEVDGAGIWIFGSPAIAPPARIIDKMVDFATRGTLRRVSSDSGVWVHYQFDLLVKILKFPCAVSRIRSVTILLSNGIQSRWARWRFRSLAHEFI